MKTAPRSYLLVSMSTAFVLFQAACSQAGARTLSVGAGKEYSTVSAAAASASDGDHIVIAPGQYFDCAVLRANNLTVEGTGPATGVVLTDKTCEGKALLITAGSNITVRNLTLTRARVPDGNGAGIRSEGANLTVEGVQFINNQNGILTSNDPTSVVTVRKSVFTKNGVCGDACAHGIYAGHIAALRVEDSVFRQTRDGHDIKSRAARTEVTGCDIAEGPDGTGSYLIEVPNGGAVIVRNNTLEKGPRSGNHTAAISIGAEGVSQATPEITVEGNTFRNDGDYHTVLVLNVTATEAALKGNTISGAATALRGDGSTN